MKDSEFRSSGVTGVSLAGCGACTGAEAYFRYAPEDKKGELARRILRKAGEFGVHVSSQVILEWAEK